MSDADVGSFIVEDGINYAGKHLLIDVYGTTVCPTRQEIEQMMVDATVATGATVLMHYSHPFDGGGSSGVVVLAESHGSFHFWPENNFVAIDIFVCGNCNPYLAVPHIEKLFAPNHIKVDLQKRGIH